MPKQQDPVVKYYDAEADIYHKRYERESIHDVSARYPANYFRVQLFLNSFANKGIKNLIEVGVGEGTPLAKLGEMGLDVSGFDISRDMVKKAKATMRKHKLNPDHIFWGDIEDPTTYLHALKEKGRFDGLMALGVMPHVRNDEMVLKNMATLVRPGGSVFIEFRNELFSLFTFNRYTHDLIVDGLLRDVDGEMRKAVSKELKKFLRMDEPPQRLTHQKKKGVPGYDAILSKFHNPFEVVELFKKHNFKDVKILWYHYHAAPPMLAKNNETLFREESIKLEHEPSNWRGYFLCSAFVIEAVKNDTEAGK